MKKTSVQNVKEQKPKDEQKSETPKGDASANVESQEVSIPSVENILEKIDPKDLKRADELGLPLTDLLLWAKNVENTQKVIVETLSGISVEKIADVLKAKLLETQAQQRAEMQQRMQNAPSGGDKGGGIGLKDILEFAGASGGGENPLQAKINELALESLTLGNTFQKVMIAKLAPELAEDLIKGAKTATAGK